MSWFERFVKLDPALFRALIMAVISLAAGLGFGWATGDMGESVWGLVGAVIAIVQGFATKPAVTANARVLAWMPDPHRPEQTKIEPGEAVAPNHRVDEVAEAAREAG